MRQRRLETMIGRAVALLLVLSTAASAESVLSPVATIPLEGVKGRIDHMAIDAARERLFVAALGNDSVEVVDLKSGKVIQTIRGVKEPQGVLFVAEADRIFLACGGDGALRIFEGPTYRTAGSVQFSSDADNIRYDKAAGLVYVGYGRGALGIVEAASGRRVGDIALPAHPESFQLESGGSRIFVNLPGAGRVAVVDRSTRSVVAAWPVSGAKDNYPMAFDEGTGRLFVGCRKPSVVFVYDTASGSVVKSFPIPGDADDLFFDSVSRRLFVSSGAGYLEVFQEDGRSIEKIATGRGSRTSLFVPETRRLYVAVPLQETKAAHILVYSINEK